MVRRKTIVHGIRRAALFKACASVSICSAGVVVNDGSLGGRAGPLTADAAGVFSITPSLGKQVGRNLFYSFGTLDLDKGATAAFSGPPSVHTVLTRVTGGIASSIDGTLRCTIPHADFYLINPAGVVFGPDAALDVQGSFVVTTADLVRLGSDGPFSASVVGKSSVLTSAAPSAFGFLGTKPASISVGAATLAVPAGKTLAVLGGDITIAGGTLRAAGGRPELASVASPGTLAMNATRSGDVTPRFFTALGAVVLAQNGSVSADGPAGGMLSVRASSLSLDHSSLTAVTTGQGAGRGIAVNLTGSLSATASVIDASTTGNPGKAGNINLRAAGLSLMEGAQISTSTFGPGKAGDVSASVSGQVVVAGENAQGSDSGIFANFNSNDAGGKAGNIRMSAGSLHVLGGAQVSSSTFGPGAGGDVSVRVSGEALVSGEDTAGFDSGIFANSNSSGEGGNTGSIHLSAGGLQVLGGAQITSSTFGSGRGGNVFLNVSGQADVFGADAQNHISGIFATSRNEGPGGNAGTIHMSAAGLQVLGGAQISSSTSGLGRGGDVTVSVTGQAVLAGEAQGIFSSASSGVFTTSNSINKGGNAGSIQMSVGALQMLDGAQISSSTMGLGQGGNVSVKVSGQAALSGADVLGNASGVFANSDSSGAGGNAGNIRLSAATLSLADGAQISSLTSGLGQGGGVSLRVAGHALLSGEDTQGTFSGIFTTSDSSDVGGNAGSIQMRAGDLQVQDGAAISSSTLGLGQGGDVSVKILGQAALSGADAQGHISGIFANSNFSGASGNAGSVRLSVANLSLVDGAQISSSTSGLGRSGGVSVRVSDQAFISGEDAQTTFSGIFSISNSKGAGGNAGSIQMRAGNLQVQDGAVISSSTLGLGQGGDVSVKVLGQAFLSGADSEGNISGIFANSTSKGASGNAGSVRLSTAGLGLVDGAEISSSTFGLGQGGDVSVHIAGKAVVSGESTQGFNSGIFADSNSSDAGGNAGSIHMTAGGLEVRNGGQITSSTFGFGQGGDVSVRVSGQAIFSGEDTKGFSSGVFATSLSDGAGGTAGVIRMRADDFELLNGARISSSTFGDGSSGNIFLTARRAKILDGGFVTAATSGKGEGGLVNLKLGRLIADRQGAGLTGVVAAALASGKGGTIRASGGTYVLRNGAQFTSSTVDAGAAGDVSLSVATLSLSGGSSVNSFSGGTGRAGSVSINASRGVTLESNALLATSSLLSDAGDLRINSGGRVKLDGASIAAEAAGAGGNIIITSPQIVRLTDSRIATDSIMANGGNIRIDPIELLLLHGSRIDANGGQNGGNIVIQADAVPGAILRGPGANVTATGTSGVSGAVSLGVFQTDLAGSLVALPIALGEGPTLAPQCGIEIGGSVSSFILNGEGGTPVQPGGYIPELDLRPVPAPLR